jgi:hypothetical protein
LRVKNTAYFDIAATLHSAPWDPCPAGIPAPPAH